MDVSLSVAYRIYDLGSQKFAIAFNVKTAQFMFLDGVSAELLQLFLFDTKSRRDAWAVENELTEAEIDDFYNQLCEFGFWNSALIENQSHQSINESTALIDHEQKYALNVFQNRLRENGMYYSFHLDLTNRCNEKCVHCYHPFDKYDYSTELSLNEVKHIIDMLYELGVFSITLSGGECLLRNDFFDILSYISDKGLMTTIFTNGTLLSENTVMRLLQYRVKLVSISIYGDNAEVHDRITTINGSFDQTMAGIYMLKKYHIPFEIKSVVLSDNIDRVENIRNLSKKINYGRDCRIDFGLCGKIDGNCDVFSHCASMEDIRRTFFSDPERYFGASQIKSMSRDDSPCGAGKYGLYCSADGSIYPCVSFRLFLCNYSDLLNISTNPVLKNWLSTKVSDFTDCLKHDYCSYCTEPCAANNLIENGQYLNSKNVSNCERAKIIHEWFIAHSK